MDKSKVLKNIMFATIFIFMLFVLFGNKEGTTNGAKKTNFTEFVNLVENKKIETATIQEKQNGVKEIKYITTDIKKGVVIAPNDSSIFQTMLKNNVKIDVIEEKQSLFWPIFISWFPMILLIGVWIWFIRKQSGGGKGGVFGFGKSKITMIDKTKNTVSFADVIGCDEAKAEVSEIVDFLKNPEKFNKLGAKIPRGILLMGPAGTGKTMLAKAIAHEADVPFFHTSGSSFVEMFVGVGAARIRDMFEEAKKHSPSIIFIDEIDALGQRRNSSAGHGNDEREQTLNQLLVEMDGMETNTGIIIIGATNRSDMLDPALLRPGRLDRQVVVGLPDVKGREKILESYVKNVPIDVALDLSKVARGTPGFSGAELANLVNEAAIFASRLEKKFVDLKDFENAKDKIIIGPERRSMVMPESERINTAYHEAGHAVVAKMIPNSDPVHKVTIIPRGRALGVTMQLPEEDKYAHDKQYLLDQIAILMGGRLAEEIFLNHMTTGASNDIERATNLARKMVMEWGMSETLGPIAYGDKVSGGFLGGGYSTLEAISPETKISIDKEIKNIIMEQYNFAKDLLMSNKDIVESMAKALLDIETIDDWQINNIMMRKDVNDDTTQSIIHLEKPKQKKEDKVIISVDSPIEEKQVAIIDDFGLAKNI